MRRFKVSQRRACRVVGQHRSSQRYEPVPTDFEQQLLAAMRKLADRYPRFGYRRVHAMLVVDGWAVNVRRVERLWHREGLRVPPPRSKQSGQKAIGTDAHALWALPSTGRNDVWSYDFLSLRTDRGTALRVLNVVDEFTRVCVGFHADYTIGSSDVRRVLERLFEMHGRPRLIRSDNGREFRRMRLISKVVLPAHQQNLMFIHEKMSVWLHCLPHRHHRSRTCRRMCPSTSGWPWFSSATRSLMPRLRSSSMRWRSSAVCRRSRLGSRER
jgi:hypothetical protein